MSSFDNFRVSQEWRQIFEETQISEKYTHLLLKEFLLLIRHQSLVNATYVLPDD